MDDVNKCYTAVANGGGASVTYSRDSTVLSVSAQDAPSGKPVDRFAYIRWNSTSRQTESVAGCVLPNTPEAKAFALARFRERDDTSTKSSTSRGDDNPTHAESRSASAKSGRDPSTSDGAEPNGAGWDVDSVNDAGEYIGPSRTNLFTPSPSAATTRRVPNATPGMSVECWLWNEQFECDPGNDMCLPDMGGFWDCSSGCVIVDLYSWDEGYWVYLKFCNQMSTWEMPSGNTSQPTPPFLELDCPVTTVTVGDELSCEVYSNDYGTVTADGWTYYLPNLDSISRTDDPTNLNWTGILASAGQIHVYGNVGSEIAIPATMGIGVQPRGWTWRGDTSNAQAPPGDDCFSIHHHLLGLKPAGKAWGGSVCLSGDVLAPNWRDSTANGFTFAEIASGPNKSLWYVTSMTTRMDMRWLIHKDLRADGFTYRVAPSDTATADSVHVDMHPKCHQHNVVGPPPDSTIVTLTTANVTCWNWVNQNSTQGGTTYASFDSLVVHAERHEKCHGIVAIRRFSGVGGVSPIADEKSRADTMVRQSRAELLGALRVRVGLANDSVRTITEKLDTTVVVKSFLFFQRDSADSYWRFGAFGALGKLC